MGDKLFPRRAAEQLTPPALPPPAIRIPSQEQTPRG
jgi:hypothetical protein